MPAPLAMTSGPRKNQFTPVQCGRTGTLLYLTTTVTVIELAELIVVRPNRSPLGQFAVLEFCRSFDILQTLSRNSARMPNVSLGISSPRKKEEDTGRLTVEASLTTVSKETELEDFNTEEGG